MATSEAAKESVRVVQLEDLDQRYRTLRLPASASDKRALERSLERHGLQQPLLASSGVAVGCCVILDGFKRVEALAARGVTEALARIVALDVPASLAALFATNSDRQGLGDFEEAWVVEALSRDSGLNQPQIGELLGRSKTWVCRRIKLVQKLERCVQDDVRLGLITPTAARELVRLPRGNQARAAEAITRFDLSSRQAHRLVDALLDTDVAGRRAIFAAPLEHVAPTNSVKKPTIDARLSEDANRVRQQLLRLHGAANRLDELLLERAPGRFDERDVSVLRELAPRILAKAEVAIARVRELLEPDRENVSRAS